MSDPVYILASGQSNMVGNIRTLDTTINPDIEVWNPATQSWEVARISDELDPVTGMSSGANIAFAAAQSYQAEHGGTVRLIIDCEGGRPLDDWLQGDKHNRDGTRYDSLSAQHSAAGAPKIDLFLFAQGEANRDDASLERTTINTRAEYETGLLSYFDQLCADRVLGYDSWIMMPELIQVEGSGSYHRNDVISNFDDLGLAALHTLETDHTNADLVRDDAVHWGYHGIMDVGARAADLLSTLQMDGPEMIRAQHEAEVFDDGAQVSYLASTERVAVNLGTGNGALGLAENDVFHSVSGVVGTRFEDYLKGGEDDDRFMGDRSDDKLFGEGGDDILFGGGGADILRGGTGGDRLFGGGGSDRLFGGASDDILTGGLGNDLFVFDLGSGRDAISDFTPGEDLIDLRGLSSITGGDIEYLLSRITEDIVQIDTTITLGETSIILWGISRSDLSHNDFLL